MAQMLTLAQALAYQGLGDQTQAKAKLKAVVALGAKTATGVEAQRLLEL